MMDETASANMRMEAERAQDQIRTLIASILFGWVIGFQMGTGLGYLATDYARARQDLQSQIAEAMTELSTLASGASSDYVRGLMDALAESAYRLSTDENTPVSVERERGPRRRPRRRNREAA